MSNRSKVDAERLAQLAQSLRKNHDEIEHEKSRMNRMLDDMMTRWRDPVAHGYRVQYETDLRPINQKLLPGLINLQNYLNQVIDIINNQFAGNR